MPAVDASPPARRPGGKRRLTTLLIGIALIGSGVALATFLSERAAATHDVQSAAPAVPRVPGRMSPDQRLADRIMLNRNDLPVGWKVEPGPASADDSAGLERGEAAITRAFAGCMGVTDGQATVLLGGQSSDQTAQTASPIFGAPPSTADPGFAVQLQTAASIVRTRVDEQSDLGLFANPRYAGCASTAIASELQLGLDGFAGGGQRPGPATGTLVSLPGAPGEQVTALRVTCSVVDAGATVPVEVETVLVGSDRIEADLEAFAVGGPIPVGVVDSSVEAFEQRVSSGGEEIQI
jgi:hypothetical protein